MTTTISGSNGIVFPDATSMQTGQQAVKAWVNFKGTSPQEIRAAYNVSSLTDHDVGDVTINFTTAMPDENYAIAGATIGSQQTSGGNLTTGIMPGAGAPAAGSVRMTTRAGGVTRIDVSYVQVAIFR